MTQGALFVIGTLAHFDAVAGGGVTECVLRAVEVGLAAHPPAALAVRGAVFLGSAYVIGGAEAKACADVAAISSFTVQIAGAIGSQLLARVTGDEQAGEEQQEEREQMCAGGD